MRRPRVSEINGATNGAVAKIPQPHGGALNSGGTPGHRGGGGRPPGRIREAARLGFDEKIDKLIEVAEDAEKDSDKLKAIELLGKYGLGSAKGHDDVLVRRLAQVVQQHVSDEGVLSVICDGWVAAISEHIRGA